MTEKPVGEINTFRNDWSISKDNHLLLCLTAGMAHVTYLHFCDTTESLVVEKLLIHLGKG